MSSRNKYPENPLEFIQSCVRQRHILWTYHANMRMRNRFIKREEILASTEQYEIIEEYPDDKYMLSYLVLSEYGNDIFHVLFAVDVTNGNVRIITAYHPSPMEWEPDFKTRRINR